MGRKQQDEFGELPRNSRLDLGGEVALARAGAFIRGHLRITALA